MTDTTSMPDSYKLLNYSLMLLGAVYIGHWVDAYFFTRPDFDRRGRKWGGWTR